MNVYVVSYRDEFRTEPLELVAFRDEQKAGSVSDRLTRQHGELFASGEDEQAVNEAWHLALKEAGVPEERSFSLDLMRHTNFAFSVKALEFVE